jgi:hypothetical protein
VRGTGDQTRGLCGTCAHWVPTIKGDRRFCRRIFYRSFVARDHAGLITDCDDYKKARQGDAMGEVWKNMRALCRECRRFAGGRCTHGWLPVPTMTPIGNMWTCKGEIPTRSRMRLLQKEMERSLAKAVKSHGIDLDDVLDRIKVKHLLNGNVEMSGNLNPGSPQLKEPLSPCSSDAIREMKEWLDARSKWPGFVRDQISESKPAEADPPKTPPDMLRYNCAWDSEGRTTCGHVAKLESRLAKAKRLLRRLLAKDLCHRKSLYLGGCRPDCPACAVLKFLENDDGKKEG